MVDLITKTMTTTHDRNITIVFFIAATKLNYVKNAKR